jgi:hypothetical protein
MFFATTSGDTKVADFDYYRIVHEDGTVEITPAAATAEEIAARELDALRRALAGVEHRIATLPPAGPGFFHPPTEADRARMLAELENERDATIAALERAGASEPKRRRRL